MSSDRWREVSRLYHAAMAQPANARAAFLAEACTDVAMRQEVQALLAQPVSAPGFLEPGAFGAAMLALGDAATLTGCIGPYEIQGLLGAGGMGEVYRARDPRLARDVAIKILPREFTNDAARLARFEREARILAALNHPNIGAIYGLEDGPDGDDGPTRALILELVEGETLEDRLVRGPLPLHDALTVATQVAGALQVAHEKGIVHRDLKPANIKIIPDGVVKVLDFGLAKMTSDRVVGKETAAPTRDGLIVGTVAYMSPEQTRGQDVDTRADIWAFGCVLYEMLTGKRAFEGDTLTDIMAAVVSNEPDWQALPPATPPAIRSILRRCLHKDVSRRRQHIGDAGIEIQEALAEPPPSPAIAGQGMSVTTSRRRRFGLPLAIAVSAAGLLTGFGFVWQQSRQAAPIPVRRFTIDAPAGATRIDTISVSPTGADMALVGTDDRRNVIWVRPMETLEARRVLEFQGPATTFWSPDGESLGFFEGGKLKVVDLATGQTRIVCDAPDGSGGSWGPDDTILFAAGESGIRRVSARGGPITTITSPRRTQGEHNHRWPQWLPDGRHFIYLAWIAPGKGHAIHIGSVDSQTATFVASSQSAPLYDSAGYILFIDGIPSRLVALPFDTQALKVTGAAITVAEDAEHGWTNGLLPLATAPDGSLFYLNSHHRYSRLTWFDRSGRQGESLGETAIYFHPALSADGRSLVIEKADPNSLVGDVWSVDLDRDTFSRVTSDPGFDSTPVWSPDGRSIVFSSDRDGDAELYTVPAIGGTAQKLFSAPDSLEYATDWSRDGRYLLFMAANQEGVGLWALPMPYGGEPIAIQPSNHTAEIGMFSPDSKWVAYVSNESGVRQVYVQSWPDSQIKRQISTNGGGQPHWRSDGKELFYISRDGTLMAVSIVLAPGRIESQSPVALFNAGLGTYGLRNNYVVALDGQRFLLRKPVVDRRSAPITTILNWPVLVKH
jgi:Tol biopolymer transport system component